MSALDAIRQFRAEILARNQLVDDVLRVKQLDDPVPGIERRTVHIPSTPFQRVEEEEPEPIRNEDTGTSLVLSVPFILDTGVYNPTLTLNGVAILRGDPRFPFVITTSDNVNPEEVPPGSIYYDNYAPLFTRFDGSDSPGHSTFDITITVTDLVTGREIAATITTRIEQSTATISPYDSGTPVVITHDNAPYY